MPLTFVLPPSLGPAKAAARAELIEGALAKDLGERVTVLVAESYGELEHLAVSGKAELVWAPTVVCTRLPRMRAIFTVTRDGVDHYCSALIMRREAGRMLDELAGLRAAWVDPLSAGGYLLAVGLLRSRGIEPDVAFSSQTFAGSHRAAIEAVLHGTADVAAVSAREPDEESIAAILRWYAGPATVQLGAIGVSESCLNDALVITPGVAEAEAARLVDRLIPSAPGPRARSRLLSALEAERLERAEMEDYWRLRPLFALEPGSRPSSPPSGARSERPLSGRRSERPR